MANKEALRELQSRLAERLQEARELTEQPGVLAGGRSRGQGSSCRSPRPARSSAAGAAGGAAHQPWFLGVANLRGGLARRGRPGRLPGPAPAPPAWQSGVSRPACWRSTRYPGQPLRAAGRPPGRAAAPDQLVPPDAHDAGAPGLRRCWRDRTGRVWQEIDLAALARSPAVPGHRRMNTPRVPVATGWATVSNHEEGDMSFLDRQDRRHVGADTSGMASVHRLRRARPAGTTRWKQTIRIGPAGRLDPAPDGANLTPTRGGQSIISEAAPSELAE
jgi:twitching motility protein PilI